MLHCGYQPTAVNHTFASFGGMFATVKAMIFNTYASPRARKMLDQERDKPRGPLAHLVQIGMANDVEMKVKGAA